MVNDPSRSFGGGVILYSSHLESMTLLGPSSGVSQKTHRIFCKMNFSGLFWMKRPNFAYRERCPSLRLHRSQGRPLWSYHLLQK